MERVKCGCTSTKDFLDNSDWDFQYTNVYQSRLKQLKPLVEPPSTWKDSTAVARILNLKHGELSWVSGVVYRDSANKPSVLVDVDLVNHGEKPAHGFQYSTKDDKYFLEDEQGRMMLIGKELPRFKLVTGVVCAVLGCQNRFGDFDVLDVAFPSLKPVGDLPAGDPSSVPSSQATPNKIALVSGLLLGSSETGVGNKALLIEFLAATSTVSRLIIAGDLLEEPGTQLVGTRVMHSARSPESLSELDRLLAVLSTILPCNVLPGASDPNTAAFPQPALSPALFSYAKSLIANGALTLNTNPAQLQLENGVTLLGTSGQPVKDVCRYLGSQEEINLEHESLTSTLKWAHLAPTAPDTLWSPPVRSEDKLTILERPNVLFAGNRTGYRSTFTDGVRVVSVPRFKTTGQLVLLDVDTLETELVELV